MSAVSARKQRLHVTSLTTHKLYALLARLQTWRAIIFSRVCLWVCVCVSLTGTSTLQRWPISTKNLVTRTLLWSSLAATIMVQIGLRGTARRLFEIFKKFSKITEIEFQNSGPSFLRLCLLCIVWPQIRELAAFGAAWRRNQAATTNRFVLLHFTFNLIIDCLVFRGSVRVSRVRVRH